MYLFTIEGNIGSGKSTFIELLQKEFKHMNGVPVVYIPEPVEEWTTIQSKDGKNMIELFYEDKHKYAFSFQMMAYISRLDYLRKMTEEYPNCILISERSLYADYYVFAKMLFEDGYISSENYQIYQKWFHTFLTDIDVTGIIYLKTPATTCIERCGKRSRKGEENIPSEYIINCGNKHDDWIDNTIINSLVIEDNTIQEVDQLKKFIKDELNCYKLSILTEDDMDNYMEDNYIFQIASVVCVIVIVFGYLAKVGVICYRIVN
jgi:deoxyadenosine/deoxycytidine kinase